MRVTELKAYLMTLDQKTLVSEVAELFQKFAVVKDYYEAKLDSSSGTITLDKYKDIITKEFFPKRGVGKARLSVARKAVTDFKKIASKPSEIADIMLHYVEEGVGFSDEYGGIDEPFYYSMESMYEAALKFIVLNNLIDHYQDRSFEITEEATEGWGFKDSLSYLFKSNIIKDND